MNPTVKVILLIIIIVASGTFVISTLSSSPTNQSVLSRIESSIPPHTQTAALGDLTSGLVAHYTFDDVNNLGADSSGNSNNGTPINGPTATAGKVGGGVKFDGVDDKISSTNLPTLQGASAMSISAWVKPVSIGNLGFAHICGSGDPNKIFEFYQRNSGGNLKFNFDIRDSSGVTYKQTTNHTYNDLLNKWILVTGVYDHSNVNIYVNGVLDNGGVVSFNGDLGTATQVMEIGKAGCNAPNYYNGSLDDVRIYNRVLTPDEITQLYALDSTPPSDSGEDNTTPPSDTPINGSCSTTVNTCTAGTFSDITDTSTNYLWSCLGTGGTTASCSSPIPATPPAGDTTPPVITNTPPPAGAQVIGREALIPFPPGGFYSRMVNFRPGNNEVVHANPPAFSWLYNLQDPNNVRDTNVKQFRFQVSYNSNMSNPVVDVVTDINVYNTIAPFSQNVVYWRIGYIDTKASPGQILWSPILKFTIAQDAILWDRSMLADQNYLDSKSAHPHLIFNSQNRAAISDFVRTTNSTEWRQIIKDADQAITLSWWKDKTIDDGAAAELAAMYVSRVAFAWQMTKDQKYLNADPQSILVKAAQMYKTSGRLFTTDMVSGPGAYIKYIGYAYDWLYEVMTPEQRAIVAELIGEHCQFQLLSRGSYYLGKDRTTDNPMLGQYPSDRIVYRGDFFNYNESHNSDDSHKSLIAALAAYGENEWAKKFVDYNINFLIGRPYFNGNEEGNNNAGYTYLHTVVLLYKTFLLNSVFPEAKLYSNPLFKSIAEWYSRIRPVGTQLEPFSWGVANNYLDGEIWEGQSAKFLAYMSGSKIASYHADEEKKTYSTYRIPISYFDSYALVAFDYFFHNPGSEVLGETSKVYPLGGWAFASTYPTNTPDAFKKGLGFVFVDRPDAGVYRSADGPVDLSFELWAYGQTITENSATDWSYNQSSSQSHNSLFVNGIGPLDLTNMYRSISGRIFAFKSTPSYVYVAGEGKNAFPSSTRNILNRANRHLMMIRNKYFVIFDDVEAGTDATFSQLYHIPEDTLVLDQTQPSSYRYTRITPQRIANDSTFPYTAIPIEVFVSHIEEPTSLKVDDMRGDMRTKNPITGVIFPPPPGGTGDSSVRGDRRVHALWYSNKTPTTSFHFLTVIYPKNPADDTAGKPDPKIERLDDYTAKVTNPDGTVDVISFNNNPQATIAVDLSQLTPLPVVDDVTGTTVTSVPYVPPPSNPPPNTPPSTTLPGDFDHNNIVNSLDLSLLTSKWNQSNTTYDLTGDGLVNTLDYVVMVKNWTR